MTMIVPSASDSGMLRRGSFTSPAVKVMLFQASAEKSDPVCDDADGDEQAERCDRRQPRHDFDRAARCSTCCRSCRRTAVCSTRAAAPTRISADQRAGFGGREDVLDDPSVFEAARVRPGEQRDQQDADQLRRRQRQRVAGRSGGLAGSGSGRRRSTGTSTPK